MSLKSMLSDKPLPRVLLLITKNSSTKPKRDKLKNFFCNTTELSSSLTQEDANLKSTVVQVPEQDIKNLIDDWLFFYKLSHFLHLIHKSYKTFALLFFLKVISFFILIYEISNQNQYYYLQKIGKFSTLSFQKFFNCKFTSYFWQFRNKNSLIKFNMELF